MRAGRTDLSETLFIRADARAMAGTSAEWKFFLTSAHIKLKFGTDFRPISAHEDSEIGFVPAKTTADCGDLRSPPTRLASPTWLTALFTPMITRIFARTRPC